LGRLGKVANEQMKVSLIAVCHHSSQVLSGCVGSFRREAAVAGLVPEVVVVEHSEDDREAVAVEASAPDTVIRRPNRGYAAGLNTGAGAATGDVLFLANPDIEFLSGSVAALVDAATAGTGVVGPTLLWDRDGEVFLPIPDDPSPRAELRRTLDRRWPSVRALERIAEQSWRVWTAGKPCRVPSLRGPLLALGRDTASRLGPLDEGYFLYYEETEWLWRARRAGVELRVAPQSRVVHRWGHSTRTNSDSGAVEERSRTRFFERNYPKPYRALLGRLAPRTEARGLDFPEVSGPEETSVTEADIWLASHVKSMQPSIGGIGSSRIPSAIKEIEGVDRWYAVVARRVNSRWRLQGRWMWQTS